jgi:hypothetical protein
MANDTGVGVVVVGVVPVTGAVAVIAPVVGSTTSVVAVVIPGTGVPSGVVGTGVENSPPVVGVVPVVGVDPVAGVENSPPVVVVLGWENRPVLVPVAVVLVETAEPLTLLVMVRLVGMPMP